MAAESLLVFSLNFSARHEYILRTVLGTHCGLNWRHTDNPEEFRAFDGARINYSGMDLGGLQVLPCGILDATGWQRIVPETGMQEEIPVLFPDPNGSLGFDVFGAAFWMLTRHEEYGMDTRDVHGRIVESECLMVANNWHTRPLVDLWILDLWRELKARYPQISGRQRTFSYTPTFDIDNAFAYAGKGFNRNAGALLRDKFRFRWGSLWDRWMVMLGARKDPYDTYDYLIQKLGSDAAVFFFLVADRGAYDKNLPHTSKRLKKLAQRLAEHHTCGVHPGYHAHLDSLVTEAQKARVYGLTGKEVGHSRQHFLRLKIPDTYRLLARAGIKSDHTMGFSGTIGFRAGTSVPFTMYDVELDEDTFVQVVPFAYMDGSLNEYMKLDPPRAIEAIRALTKEVKKVNGHFEFIWHNETLNEKRHWKGWRVVFEQTLEEWRKK